MSAFDGGGGGGCFDARGGFGVLGRTVESGRFPIGNMFHNTPSGDCDAMSA